MRRRSSFQLPATSFRHGHQDSLAIRKTLVASMNPILAKLLSLDKVRDVYEAARDGAGTNIFHRILENMNVACSVSDSDLARVPETGACVVVANHPFGILDGILLGALLLRVRSDLKILTNYMLTGVPGLDEYCIPLDPFGGKKQSALSDQDSAIPTATATLERGRTEVLSETENGCSNQRGLRGAKEWL